MTNIGIQPNISGNYLLFGWTPQITIWRSPNFYCAWYIFFTLNITRCLINIVYYAAFLYSITICKNIYDVLKGSAHCWPISSLQDVAGHESGFSLEKVGQVNECHIVWANCGFPITKHTHFDKFCTTSGWFRYWLLYIFSNLYRCWDIGSSHCNALPITMLIIEQCMQLWNEEMQTESQARKCRKRQVIENWEFYLQEQSWALIDVIGEDHWIIIVIVVK